MAKCHCACADDAKASMRISGSAETADQRVNIRPHGPIPNTTLTVRFHSLFDTAHVDHSAEGGVPSTHTTATAGCAREPPSRETTGAQPNMKHSLTRLFLAIAFLATATSAAFAQGGASSSISGVVVDPAGGVIPGATVTAKNDATTAASITVSGSNGAFVIPALPVDTYTVTVSLQGFKTALLKGIAVTAGTPAELKAVLEIGGVEQTVTVEGAAQVISTQNTSVSTTLNSDQIIGLPSGTRNTLDLIAFLPGVQTPGNTRDSIVNGLPQSSIAITMDGISIQDNYLKTGDGFFARMSPRIDAVEEVTV